MSLRTPFVRRLLPAVCLCLSALWTCTASAQAPSPGTGLTLRSSPRLQEKPSDAELREGRLYLQADQLQLRPDLEAVLEGQVLLRRPGMVIRADQLVYDQSQDRVQATGHVQLNQRGNRFEGPAAQLQIDSMQGQFDSPRYQLSQGGHGDARSIDFIDEARMAAQQARYSTCRVTPGPEWLPEWFMTASRIRTDTAEGMGQAEDVQLHFKGLSSPRLPDVRFPLESNRMTGLLSPVLSIDTINGIDYMQPWYWDIAPNRDATVVARTMSKRGLGMESELRYLERDYNGQVRLNWLPHDQLRQEQRWGLVTQHNGSIDTGLPSVGRLGASLAISRVSDDNYWRDFPRSYLNAGGVAGVPAGLTQRALPSTGVLSWGRGSFSMVGLVQRWQVQQDVNAPITPPYDRAPQLTMRYGRFNDAGLDWSVVGDTTRFEADFSRLANAVAKNGTRSYTQAQVSRPWIRPWGYITPKLQLHATRYDMDNAIEGQRSFDRVLPTVSLDSGLVFERETQWFQRGLVQTLEPRIFYARTGFSRQDMLPLYDTGMTDFNLSTIYSENPYVGQDRIVDNNTVTFGVNSRLFDSQSGAELLRVGVAQRLRLSDQRVSINPNAAEDQAGLSDLLVGAGVRWTDTLSADGTVQMNNQTHQVRRSTLQARYNPGPYRLLNVAYRQNRLSTAPSELIDLGWQWPLSDLRWGARPDDSGVRAGGQGLGEGRWYGVGRTNYSLQDKQLVNALVGFEYDAGCWIGRVAFERLQSSTTSSNSRILFQLELVGFGRVGISPLESLRRNIPRYQLLRENTTAPSRFLHYE